MTHSVILDTNCCARMVFGNQRPFHIRIMDNAGKEVLHLDSPLRCDTCWFPCCLKVSVYTISIHCEPITFNARFLIHVHIYFILTMPMFLI